MIPPGWTRQVVGKFPFRAGVKRDSNVCAQFSGALVFERKRPNHKTTPRLILWLRTGRDWH